ncbi:CotH kinase family protein [bacterium]|nr:CotH kinase family protein [bacterium]
MDRLFKHQCRAGICLACLCLFTCLSAAAQTLCINEICASNQTLINDGDGESSDWLELYNPGPDPVNLAGHTLSDNPGNIGKWTLPQVLLAPGACLLVWASGKDSVSDAELHASFKLDADGEFIGFYAPDGRVLDSLSFGFQSPDQSLGRFPDGSGNMRIFLEPSPGRSNIPAAELQVTESGVYANGFAVSASSDLQDGIIRYTTNGDAPGPLSAAYSAPLALQSTMVVRMAVFLDTVRVSNIETRTYFVGEQPGLPALSIVMAPDDLWSDEKGIYENPLNEGDEWERSCDLSLIETGETRFQVPAGIRIHGQTSRPKDKKNFRLYFRDEYGLDNLDYPLFPQTDVRRFKRLVLQASLIPNILSPALWYPLGGIIAGYTPVVLYLNGAYWGIYWIRERIDRFFIEDHFDIEDPDFIKSEWYESNLDVVEGTREYWDKTLAFFRSMDMKHPANFTTAGRDYLDIENYIDYYIINIFSANQDWPQKNIERFRDRAGDPRWLHVMWDTDAAWKAPATRLTLEWALRSEPRTDLRAEDNINLMWSTLIMRKLLENPSCRTYFINRFCDLLNTKLSANHVTWRLNTIIDQLNPEIPREAALWSNLYEGGWNNYIYLKKWFVAERPKIMQEHLAGFFGLPTAMHTVNVSEPVGSGSVKINSIIVDQYPWAGKYFRNNPVTLRAIPGKGYAFSRWGGSSTSTNAEITLSLYNSVTLQAFFRETWSFLELTVESIGDTSVMLVWKTSQPCSGRIFLESKASKQVIEPGNAGFSCDHSQLLHPLIPDKKYHLFIEAWDAAKDSATSDTIEFRTIPSGPRPPEFSLVRIDSLGTGCARIVWATGEPTTGTVFYDTQTPYRYSVTDPVPASSHRIWIRGLLDTTQYFVKISATNSDGLSGDSFINFWTLADHTAPQVCDLCVSGLTDSSAALKWTTTEEASCRLAIRPAGEETWRSIAASDTGVYHGAFADSLLPDIWYHFQIFARDGNGNEGASAPDSFRTGRDSTVPRINHIRIIHVTDSTAHLAWLTTEEATCRLMIRPAHGEAWRSIAAADTGMRHGAFADSLEPEAWYHYQIHARDGNGNQGISAPDSFRTDRDSTVPCIYHVRIIQVTDSTVHLAWLTTKETRSEVWIGFDSTATQRSIAALDSGLTHHAFGEALVPGMLYYFWVQATDEYGNRSEAVTDTFRTTVSHNPSSVGEWGGRIPESFYVSRNYPNPFNSATRLLLMLPEPGHLEVRVFNSQGKQCACLFSGPCKAGIRTIDWDISVSRVFSSGIYFMRVDFTAPGGNHREVRSLLYQK